MFIDSHAHLFFEDYKDDLDKVINRARDVGVEYIVCPGTDVETSRKSIELAERYDMVYACVGFHPHDASKADEKSLEEIEKLSHHPKVVAIGEIGLDYHYNFSPSETQRSVFARQIDIARQRNLPIVIHSRDSESDTLRIVEEKIKQDRDWRSNVVQAYGRYPAPRGVFHCFPGDSVMAWKVIDSGFYISIPGLVTFPNRVGKPNLMVEVATKVSAEHILLETDSPYLAPVPYRGKRNEPAYLKYVVEKLAIITGKNVEEVAEITTKNAENVFS